MNAAATPDMLKVPIGANHLFYGDNVALWRVVCRMRCRDCGAAPERVEMLHGVDEARSVRAVRTVRLV